MQNNIKIILIGRKKKEDHTPRTCEIWYARKKFISIILPKINPKIIGPRLIPPLASRYAIIPKINITPTPYILLIAAYEPITENAIIVGANNEVLNFKILEINLIKYQPTGSISKFDKIKEAINV